MCFSHSLFKVFNLVFPCRLIGYFLLIIIKTLIQARTENITAHFSRFTQTKLTNLFKCFGRTFLAIFLMFLFFVISCFVGYNEIKYNKIKSVNAKLNTIKSPRESNLRYLA